MVILYNVLIALISVGVAVVTAKIEHGQADIGNSLVVIIGGLLLTVAIVLRTLATHQFYAARMTTFHLTPQNKLITTGIFRVSRNPHYVALVLQQLGAACLFPSVGGFVIALGIFIWWQIWLISFEELALHRHFGEDYRDYQKRTPRWLVWK